MGYGMKICRELNGKRISRDLDAGQSLKMIGTAVDKIHPPLTGLSVFFLLFIFDCAVQPCQTPNEKYSLIPGSKHFIMRAFNHSN
jgi:hypothetical protein